MSSSAASPPDQHQLSPPSDRLTYIPCFFCHTPLQVRVPCNIWLTTISVRCGHCKKIFPIDTSCILYMPPAATAVSANTAAN